MAFQYQEEWKRKQGIGAGYGGGVYPRYTPYVFAYGDGGMYAGKMPAAGLLNKQGGADALHKDFPSTAQDYEDLQEAWSLMQQSLSGVKDDKANALPFATPAFPREGASLAPRPEPYINRQNEKIQTNGIHPYPALAMAGASDMPFTSEPVSVQEQNTIEYYKIYDLLQKDKPSILQSFENVSKMKGLINVVYAANAEDKTLDEFFELYPDQKLDWLEGIRSEEYYQQHPDERNRMRPMEELVTAYLRGDDLEIGGFTPPEYDAVALYAQEHQDLFGGTSQQIFGFKDTRENLGKTAYAALRASDSVQVPAQEKARLMLFIGEDMDAAKLGNYKSLEDFYDHNPDRAKYLSDFVAEEKLRTDEENVRLQALAAEDEEQIKHAALTTLKAYANGEDFTPAQNAFWQAMLDIPLTDDDRMDPVFVELDVGMLAVADDEIPNADAYGGFSLDDMINIKSLAGEILESHVRLAKSAGLTLGEMYELFPQLRMDPYGLTAAALPLLQEQKNGKSIGVYEWLTGVDPSTLNGEGMGLLQAMGKGVEMGGRKVYNTGLKFVHYYITEKEAKEIQAWNRKIYGGKEGRSKARNSFLSAINRLDDSQRQAYWKNYLSEVKDILELPFNFSDEAVLNAIYNNEQGMAEIEDFVRKKATPAEFAAYYGTGALTEAGSSMLVAAGITTFTGCPFFATLVTYGPSAAVDGYEAASSAGLSKMAAKGIGAASALIAAFTERIAFDEYMKPLSAHKGAAFLEETLLKSGTPFAKTIAAKAVVGVAKLTAALIDNMATEMTSEAFQTLLNDIWLNVVNAQDKDAGQMLDDATRAAVMAGILSPLLSAEGFALQGGQKIILSDEQRVMVESFIESELGPSLMTPEALAKSINDAEAAKMEGTIGESGHGNTQGVEGGADSNLQGEGGEAADSAYGDTVETDLNTGMREYGTAASQAPGYTYAPAYAVPAMIGTNEHVTVAGIENVGDNPTVRLADGRSVPMGQVTFGNYGTQAIYETAGEFEQSANANRFLQVYQNSGMEAADFLQLYLNVYQEEIQNQRVLGDRTQTGLSEYMPSGLPPHMNRLLGQAGVPIQGNQRNQAGQGQRPAVLRDKPFALQDMALPGTLNLSNGTLETINTMRAGEGLPPMEGVDFAFDQAGLLAKNNESDIIKEGTQGALGEDGGGLNWDKIISKKGETRLAHINRHSVPNQNRASHSVFNDDPQTIINDAWGNRGDIMPINDGMGGEIYNIPYRNAGYESGYINTGVQMDYVTIIVISGTNDLVAAFPSFGDYSK